MESLRDGTYSLSPDPLIFEDNKIVFDLFIMEGDEYFHTSSLFEWHVSDMVYP